MSYVFSEFIKILTKPIHSDPTFASKRTEAKNNEISLSAIDFCWNFVDSEGVLETAKVDFEKFLSSSDIKISTDGIPFSVEFQENLHQEEHIISVTKSSVKLSASDTEGIRRGLIFIEDEMKRRCGTFLPLGEIRRKPFIKKRISRCYFTPPSHASNEGLENELAMDADFYPDEYLNRLAHDGINALWLGACFRDILKSEIIPEYGADSDRRIEKLRQIVKKCKRYGIGIYLFSVEPASTYKNPVLKNNPELIGGKGWGGTNQLFCISTENGEKYLREAIKRLFTEVPGLAGFIGITTGECLSACGSDIDFNCPRCKKKYGTHANTLAATEKIIVEEMAEVAPSAEFISWTYSQRAWSDEDVAESCELRDKRVIHMQNFEDLGRPVQLGRERLAIDYWLSYVGPGELMKKSITINQANGIRTYAKIQACSSHEISTIPYVPAPGILYDKFSYMRENSIDGVMLCWYFGNYPCLMNKSACELSFEPYMTTKLDFLRHIAGIYFGENVDLAVKSFAKFEEGYKNYPVNVAFEWYGPMQDSPAAPLYLLPRDRSMPESWLCGESLGGDRIGEALLDGHTLEEALELCQRMHEDFSIGAGHLSSINGFTDEIRDIQSVSSALAILFKSGYNTLKFYSTRHKLALSVGDSNSNLDILENIVREEINNSKILCELSKNDKRLGFHPEAHGYKFSPDLLEKRIEALHTILKTEFPVVRKRIDANLTPIEFYLGNSKNSQKLVINAGEDFLFKSVKDKAHTSLSVSEKCGKLTITLTLFDESDDYINVYPEFHLFHPSAPFTLKGGLLNYPDNNQYSFCGEFAEKRRKALSIEYKKNGDVSKYIISFSRKDFDILENEPVRIAAERHGKHNESLLPHKNLKSRLIFGSREPSDYIFIIKQF